MLESVFYLELKISLIEKKIPSFNVRLSILPLHSPLHQWHVIYLNINISHI